MSPQTNQVWAQPSGRAQFTILNFDNSTITWSLQIAIDGNHPSAVLAVGLENGVVYRYPQFDAFTNTTTLTESLSTSFTTITAGFPNEDRVLSIYFAVEAVLPLGSGSTAYVPLPTGNYVGMLQIASLAGSFYSERQQTDKNLQSYGYELQQIGLIYWVNLDIHRTPDSAAFISTAMVDFPQVLWFLVYVLTLLIPIQLVLYIHAILRRRNCRQLLNSNYFAIAIGLLFFVPIFTLSLEPMTAPITFTPGDLQLFNLMKWVGLLLPFSFTLSLFRPKESKQT